MWPTHEVLSGHTGAVFSLSVHGEKILSGSSDMTFRMWDSSAGTGIGEPLSGDREGVRCVTFSPDGKQVKGHLHNIHCVAFSPDDAMVISSDNDYKMRLWSIAEEELCWLSHG